MKLLSFEAEFTRRHPNRPQILRFMREAIGTDEVQYSDLTLTNLERVRDLMLERLAQNSAQVYCAIIKAFLNTISEEVELPTLRFAKALKVKTVPSQHCCLTEEELIKFDEYVPKNQNELDVKILFMRGAFSGARASDCRELSTANIHDKTLSYVSIKTKICVELPIHKRLEKYISQKPSKNLNPSTVNRIIQRICRKLGIDEPVTLFVGGKTVCKPKYQLITMHSSRRSFVSALAVRGVPMGIISKLAGHRSTNMTDRYVAIGVRRLDSDTLEFFND